MTKEYGERLKTIRETLGLTQETLGADFGVKQGNYSAYERGKLDLSVDKLKTLFEHYKVNPFYYFFGKMPVLLEGKEEQSIERLSLRRLKQIFDVSTTDSIGLMRSALNELLDEIMILLEEREEYRGSLSKLEKENLELTRKVIELNSNLKQSE